MTDSQPKGTTKRDKAEAGSKGVEERMERFEASTAKMQGTIGDLAAVLKGFMDQAEIKGQTYASTLIERPLKQNFSRIRMNLMHLLLLQLACLAQYQPSLSSSGAHPSTQPEFASHSWFPIRNPRGKYHSP
jgi:hypothetical protein